MLTPREDMIQVLDLVVLMRDRPDAGLKAGDIGTVVLVHAAGSAYEVEFSDAEGRTIAVLAILAADIRRAEADEIKSRHTPT